MCRVTLEKVLKRCKQNSTFSLFGGWMAGCPANKFREYWIQLSQPERFTWTSTIEETIAKKGWCCFLHKSRKKLYKFFIAWSPMLPFPDACTFQLFSACHFCHYMVSAFCRHLISLGKVTWKYQQYLTYFYLKRFFSAYISEVNKESLFHVKIFRRTGLFKNWL